MTSTNAVWHQITVATAMNIARILMDPIFAPVQMILDWILMARRAFRSLIVPQIITALTRVL